jgi:hypothetical protein
MIRRFFTRFLMVMLIAACGYNGWQVHQLQQEVVQLQAQQTHEAGHKVPVTRAGTSTSWIDQANLHLERAKDAVARADFGTAQHELVLSEDDAQRAAREPVQKTQATLAQTRRSLAALQSQADSLWRKVHPTPSVPAPERP